ncbi:MAG: hypothetical protein SVJ22_10795, partial [Halobacteriota archaeon]|nr:hypothetical protein [Halobacteriota archaeon]
TILAITSVSCITAIAADNERSEGGDGGNFLGNWHHSEMCDHCHYLIISKEEIAGLYGYCRCHNNNILTGSGVNMEQLGKVHGMDTCIACHVGSSGGQADEIAKMNIHSAHSGADCEKCHGDKSRIFTPEEKECSFCHKGGVHLAHGQRTEDMCATCHGPAGEVYKEDAESMEVIMTPNVNSIEEITVINNTASAEYPTILGLLREFVEFIIGEA